MSARGAGGGGLLCLWRRKGTIAEPVLDGAMKDGRLARESGLRARGLFLINPVKVSRLWWGDDDEATRRK